MKQCTKCKEVKPLTDFYKQKSSKDGYCYNCKECYKQYSRAYYQANRIRKINSARRWCAANKGKHRLNANNYYRKNRDRILLLARLRSSVDVSNIVSIRKRIRARDNYTCQLCSTKGTNRALDVHHIIKVYLPEYSVKANAFSNLITLCHSCHGLVEGKLGWMSFLRKKALLNEQTFISKWNIASI